MGKTRREDLIASVVEQDVEKFVGFYCPFCNSNCPNEVRIEQ